MRTDLIRILSADCCSVRLDGLNGSGCTNYTGVLHDLASLADTALDDMLVDLGLDVKKCREFREAVKKLRTNGCRLSAAGPSGNDHLLRTGAKIWDELSSDEQAAASQLGYTELAWRDFRTTKPTTCSWEVGPASNR